MKIARSIFGETNYGRTDDFILNSIKWFKIEKLHEMQIIKITHKILNNKENYYIKDLLTNNRERKTLWENKVGPLKDKYGNLTMEQNSYLYKTIAAYNKIPKEITLIIKDSIFKKWIKR